MEAAEVVALHRRRSVAGEPVAGEALIIADAHTAHLSVTGFQPDHGRIVHPPAAERSTTYDRVIVGRRAVVRWYLTKLRAGVVLGNTIDK